MKVLIKNATIVPSSPSPTDILIENGVITAIEKGIDIFYNDEIERLLGNGCVKGIRLKSGREIACQAVIMAIGTIPNTELARASGLDCKRGVVVDEYLMTSDASVYAIGEVAEYKGTIYGITAAAEQHSTPARTCFARLASARSSSTPP